MIELIKRTITIILLFSLLALLFIYGNNETVYLSIYFLSVLSFYEWININSKKNIPVILFSISMPLFFYLNIINIFYLSQAMIIAWIILIYSMIYNRDATRKFIEKYYITIGFLIFTSFFLLLMDMYQNDASLSHSASPIDNNYYFLFVITLVSSIDIFAYISGKVFGKNKIINNISPNKTLEGYLGGYVLTISLFILFFSYKHISYTYIDLLYLTIFIFLAFFGDLFMSFVKRIYNRKDTSNILPGHGGILDRLDSYFPSLPLFYIWILS